VLKTLLAAVCATALLGTASTARAQGVDEFGRYGPPRSRAETPQNVAVEIRVGRYIPAIDGELDGRATPYQTMFGTDNRYSVGLEVDWQALRIPLLGTLGPGLAFQYTKHNASGFVTSSLGQEAPMRSGEDTSLVIFPMYAVAVLRADYLARETPIPLVPYAKAGIGVAIWTTSGGAGTSNVQGTSGSGLSYGPQFALGGALLLDAFDAKAAKDMDQNTGVNNSYFFLEWYVSHLGITESQMRVGTNTWVLGVALEI
jgi:hypothetical protein